MGWQTALTSIEPDTPGRPYAFAFQGRELLACPSGALYWPRTRALLVADLHFEKASALAVGGALLPPLDSRATLEKLQSVMAAFAPEQVICLGDSFHDSHGVSRLDDDDRARLAALQAGRDWVWVLGNHDPALGAQAGGRSVPEMALDGLTLRHEAAPGAVAELSGHYHPKVKLPRRGARACFAMSDDKLILPAFGAFTGGLVVTDPVYRPLLGRQFTALALGRRRILPIPISIKDETP